MIGKSLGPYEVLSKLGEGGMGEVYRARDNRLNRDVALKVLPATFVSDPERLARLTREAQTLASLSHANIGHLYGLEQAGAAPALVMELIEGPTLDELIRRSVMGLPMSDALPIALQLAAGLEAAHDRGVIHRDLKPANVKVQDDGTVKILDFGLAKAIDPVAMSGESLSNSPTLTGRMTQLGVILGTAAYMAPEQARGKTVDRRADIWAFGCVLYEILTARRPFEGSDIADVLAKILERQPDLTALPASTPPVIRRLMARCLVKDPKQRLRDMGEARIAIDDAIAGRTDPESTITAPVPQERHSRVPWAATALALVIAAVAWLWPRSATATADSPVMRLTIDIPAEVEVFSQPQISANGQTIAFIGVRQGLRQVYYRRLAESEFHVVRGSESTQPGSALAISPDGAALAFVSSDARLFRVPLDSGMMQMIDSKAEFLSSVSWINDELVYSDGKQIVRRKAAGGDAQPLTPIDTAGGETSQDFPVASTTAALVTFRSVRAGNALARADAVAVDSGRRFPTLTSVDYQARWFSRTQFVYSKGDTLFVAPFDAANPVIGSGTPIVTDVGSVIGGLIGAAISDSGSIVYVPSTARNSQLVWVAPTGAETPLPLGPRSYQNPRVSPDGTLIAFTAADGLWVTDQRGSITRASSGNIGFPIWLPDSRRIIAREIGGRLVILNADGSGTSATIPASTSADWPASVTPDGKAVMVIRLNPTTGGDVYLVPIDGGEAKSVIATPAYDGAPQVSKDGKWLLFSSDDSGRMEIYLRRFDNASDRRWTISTNGGMHPMWSRDGRRVYYRNGQQMMVVDVALEPAVKPGTPQMVFERRYEFGPNISQANYSLNPDGQRLLMVKPDPSAQSLRLILNWPGLVKR